MRSLRPKTYETLPKLEAPAGYICLARAVDANLWRLQSASHPKRLVESLLAAADSRFGIELVSVLETDDLAASASEIFDKHQAVLSEAWLDLDEYQMEELRRSILQIDAHPSLYLTANAPAEVKAAPENVKPRPVHIRQSRRRATSRPWYAQSEPDRPPMFRQYGAKALKGYREPEPRDWRDDLDSAERWLLEMSDRIQRFRNSAEGKAAGALFFLLLAALFCLMDAFS